MLTERFTFLCSQEERKLLHAISKYLHRSQGDTVRFLIRAAASELDQETGKPEQSPQAIKLLQNEK